MEAISLRCNNCGANLKINNKTKYLNCQSCGSSLAIKKSGNAVFSETLENISDKTDALAQNSGALLLEQKIERLDREWLIEREKYAIKNKHGAVSYPEEGASSASVGPFIFVGMIGFMFMMFVYSTMTSHQSRMSNHPFFVHKSPSIDPTGFLIIFLFFFLGIVVFTFVSHSSNQKKYGLAKQKYLKKRDMLLLELEQNKE